MAQYKTIGERSFLLSELKEILQLGDKYSAYGHFKSKVLMPSVGEVNANTDLIVSLEERKVGRSVVQLDFSIKLKKTDKPKRKKITRSEAEKMARIGESWPELLKRIGKDFDVDL